MDSDDGTFDSRRDARLTVADTIAEKILKNDEIVAALDASRDAVKHSDKLSSTNSNKLLNQKRVNEQSGLALSNDIEDMIHHYCYHILVREGLLTRE